MVFFDFGPKRKIKPKVKEGQIEIRRSPLGSMVSHVLEQKDEATLAYRERFRSRRLELDMHRGSSIDGCLRRITDGG